MRIFLSLQKYVDQAGLQRASLEATEEIVSSALAWMMRQKRFQPSRK